jgi:hypothetical protein
VLRAERVPFLDYSIPTKLNTRPWINQHFFWQQLESLEPTEKPFDGFDKMLLLSWIHKHLPQSNDEPFVLNYWDLRLPNIIVDKEDNLAGIIDWDGVAAIPIRLTAISLGENFFPSGLQLKYRLDSDLDEQFRRELCRLEEKEKDSSSTKWCQMYLLSRENRFMFAILQMGSTLGELRESYPDLLEEALHRSPVSISLAAFEWEEMTVEFNYTIGGTSTKKPVYVEIQETLGLYGKSKLERWFRKIKRNTLKRWNVFIDVNWSRRRRGNSQHI